MNENRLTIVKNYEFDKPLIHKVDSIIDNCIRGCHNKYFFMFENKCVYEFQLTKTGNNEIVNETYADRSMNTYESKKNKNCSTKRFYI